MREAVGPAARGHVSVRGPRTAPEVGGKSSSAAVVDARAVVKLAEAAFAVVKLHIDEHPARLLVGRPKK